MTRSGASVAELADRFYRLSLAGLLLSGYLALVGSGVLDPPQAALLGAVVVCFALVAAVVIWKFNRGYAAIAVLACLELLVAAVVSTSLSFFLYLAVFLFFLVAALAGAEVRRSARGRPLVVRGGRPGFYARLSALTLLVAFGILALTTGLFFVLPRAARVAFHGSASARYHLPGFSGQVRLGEIGSILKRDTPAMHVRFVEARGSLFLKWRGTALSRFDGKQWSFPADVMQTIRIGDGRTILADDDQRRRTGRRVTYEVRLEPAAPDILFFAGVPEVLWLDSAAVTQSGAGVYRMGAAPRGRLRYGAISYLDGEAPAAALTPDARKGYLQLPRIDPRLAALAREAAGPASSDEARALGIERYLRDRLGYTTELPASEPADPLANFLFERRKGHCEYFASAMAVMLRTLGIPSRLITGFQGGAYNPVSGWYVIRASDAHSWVEAWVDGRGWTTFDPTPAVRTLPNLTPRSKTALYADAADLFWQDWVIGYDFERQVTLASRMQSAGLVIGARWFDRLRLAWLRARSVFMHAARAYGGLALALAGLCAALACSPPWCGGVGRPGVASCWRGAAMRWPRTPLCFMRACCGC